MVTSKAQPKGEGNAPRPRGRPKGLSPKGAATRERLFDAAISLMGEHGFEGTTLRAIATEAGVTHAMLYRHFPSKQSVVAALYGRLSTTLAERVTLPRGSWRSRTEAALMVSLDVLRPHRRALGTSTSILVGDPDWNVFAPGTEDARRRVRKVFEDAVSNASDAPKPARGAALSRLLYLLHLGVVLLWLLDKSKDQRATGALLKLVGPGLTLVNAMLKLPGTWRFVERVDGATSDALCGETEGCKFPGN